MKECERANYLSSLGETWERVDQRATGISCTYVVCEGEATRLAELSLIFSPYKLLVSPTGIADIRL